MTEHAAVNLSATLPAENAENAQRGPQSPKARQKRNETIARNRAETGFRPGDLVTIHDRTRYNGKHGHVVTTNLGEVGVSITANDNVDAWFLPRELVRR